MFCGKCGKEIREGAKFCAACGEPVRIVPGAVAAETAATEAAKAAAETPKQTAAAATPPVFTPPQQPVTQGPIPQRPPVTQGPIPPRKPVTPQGGAQQAGRAEEKKKISPIPFIIGGAALLVALLVGGFFLMIGRVKNPNTGEISDRAEVIRQTEEVTMKEDDSAKGTTPAVVVTTVEVTEELIPDTTEPAPAATTAPAPETSSSETETEPDSAAPAVLDSETASDPYWYDDLDENIAMMEEWADYLFISLDQDTDEVIGFGYVRDDGGVYDLWIFTDPQISGEKNFYRSVSVNAADAKQFVDSFFVNGLYKDYAPGGKAGILWDSPYGLCGYVHSAGEYSGNIGALGYLYDVGEINALHDRPFASSGDRLSDVAAMVKSDKQN